MSTSPRRPGQPRAPRRRRQSRGKVLHTIKALLFATLSSPDISGPAKALWVLFLVIAPFLGVFVYLIARGNRMTPLSVRLGMPTRDASAASPRAVLTRKQVDEIARLNAERDQKLVSAAEYRARRAEILA